VMQKYHLKRKQHVQRMEQDLAEKVGRSCYKSGWPEGRGGVFVRFLRKFEGAGVAHACMRCLCCAGASAGMQRSCRMPICACI
jgi:hypothetical protein